MTTRSQRLLVVLGLLVSAVFLWFAFSRLNPAAVWSHLRQAEWGPLLLGVILFFVSLALIALRWGFLLRSIRPVSLARLIELVSIGYMGNNVYPFRTGEVLRIWLLQRDDRVPVGRGATTVVVERIFDGIVMLTFIVVALAILDLGAPAIRQVVTVATPVFLVGLAVFLLLAARPDLLRRLVTVLTRAIPARLRAPVLHLTDEFLAGIECLRTPADFVGMVASSYGSWLVQVLLYYVVAFAFDIDISLLHALLMVGVVNLAGLVPASPGQLGVFEFFSSTVLIAAGIPEAPATAYALALHVVIWLPVTLLGFVYLARRGLSWAAITGARQRLDTTGTEPQRG